MSTNHPYPLPGHGTCFVCGEAGFLGLTWHHDPARGAVTAEASFGPGQQGPPGHAHGGAIFAVLDEAMGASVWMRGHRVLARKATVEFLRPVPLGAAFTVEGGCGDRDGRKVPAWAVLRLADGKEAARTEGLFVEAPAIFEGRSMWKGASEYRSRAVEPDRPSGPAGS